VGIETGKLFGMAQGSFGMDKQIQWCVGFLEPEALRGKIVPMIAE
jgi:hypothetical protein